MAKTEDGDPLHQRFQIVNIKRERIVKLAAEGLPAAIIAERLGMPQKEVLTYAKELGVSLARYADWLPG